MKARIEKVVSQLPSSLEKNTVYYVRVGNGFEVYLTNNAGLIVAYPSNYVTTNNVQNIFAIKNFLGATGNGYTGAGIRIDGNGNANTVFPTIGFHQPTLYASTLSFRGDAFHFTNINGDNYEFVRSAGYIKQGSDNNFVLTGGGSHLELSYFATASQLTNYVTLNTYQEINALKTYRQGLNVIGSGVNTNYTKIVIGNNSASTNWALSAGNNLSTEENFYIGKFNNGVFEAGFYIDNAFNVGANGFLASGYDNNYMLMAGGGANYKHDYIFGDNSTGTINASDTPGWTHPTKSGFYRPNGLNDYGSLLLWLEHPQVGTGSYGAGIAFNYAGTEAYLTGIHGDGSREPNKRFWTSGNFNPNNKVENMEFAYGIGFTNGDANLAPYFYHPIAGHRFLATQTWVNNQGFALSSQLNGKANAYENATAIGFSAGQYPTQDGGYYPYMFFDNGVTQDYIAIATRAHMNWRLDQKVNKSGDTMTGDLSLGGGANIRINGPDSNWIKSYRNTTGDAGIVAGWEYAHYLTRWKGGMRRGGGTNSLGFSFDFSEDDGATYTEKVRIQTDSNISTQNFGSANLWYYAYQQVNNKVDKAGDTMTGNLNALTISAQNPTDRLIYDNLENYGSPLRINANASLGIYLQANGNDIFYIGPSLIESKRNFYITNGSVIFTANSNSNEWTQSFSWGNHALAGYVTTSSLNSILTDYAKLEADQTFLGVNTFNKSPNVPDAQLPNHAVSLAQTNELISQTTIEVSHNATSGTTVFDLSSYQNLKEFNIAIESDLDFQISAMTEGVTVNVRNGSDLSCGLIINGTGSNITIPIKRHFQFHMNGQGELGVTDSGVFALI